MTKAIFLVLLLVPTVVIGVGREKKLMRREKKIEVLLNSTSGITHDMLLGSPVSSLAQDKPPPPGSNFDYSRRRISSSGSFSLVRATCGDKNGAAAGSEAVTCPSGYVINAVASSTNCASFSTCDTTAATSADTETCCEELATCDDTNGAGEGTEAVTCPTGFANKAGASSDSCAGTACVTTEENSADTSTCCEACGSGCEECSDGSTCTICMDGYAKIGGICQACPTNCLDCGSNPATCMTCKDGYIQPNGGDSYKKTPCANTCPQNCLRCKYDGTTQYHCQECADGYKGGGSWPQGVGPIQITEDGSNGFPEVCRQGSR